MAQAAEPPRLGLVVASEAIQGAYKKAAEAKGSRGPAAQLDCRPAFDEVLFCLTELQADGWRYATAADLQAWGKTSEELHRVAVERMRALPLKSRLSSQRVQGVQGQMWLSNINDGQDAALLLSPAAIQEVLGGEAVVAVPTQGVAVMWKPGEPMMDKVAAVGARKLFEDAGHPISPKIFIWGEEGWEVWAEVVKP